MLGKIKRIEEIYNITTNVISELKGNEVRLGLSQMINSMFGYSNMDGYVVETDQHVFHVLIDNGQSCFEEWGYISSEDDFKLFINAELIDVRITDTALNQNIITKLDDNYVNVNSVQFVDFITSNGVLQLAVYNEHNGWYGHGILVSKDNEILLNKTI